MITKTFREWSNGGYKINKGSRAVGKNFKGECVFSSDQVTRSPPRQHRSYGNAYYADFDGEEDADWAQAHGVDHWGRG